MTGIRKNRNVENKVKTDGLKYRLGVKVIAFVLLIVFVSTFVGTIVSASIMYSEGIFSTSEETFRENLYDNKTYDLGSEMMYYFLNDNCDYLEVMCGSVYNAEFLINGMGTFYETTGITGNENLIAYEHDYKIGEYFNLTKLKIEETESEDGEVAYILTSDDEWIAECIENFVDDKVYTYEEVGDQEYLNATLSTIVYVDESFPVIDDLYWIDLFIKGAYFLEGNIWQIGIASCFLSILLFVFLLMAAGYRKGQEGCQVCGTARIPYEVFFVVYCIPMAIGLAVMDDAYRYLYTSYVEWALMYMGFVMLFSVGMLTLMDFIVRVRTKTLFRNLLAVHIWKKGKTFLVGRENKSLPMKKIARKVKGLFRRIYAFGGRILGMVPFMWKAWIAYFVFCVWTYLIILTWGLGVRIVLWFITNILMLPVFTYLCIMFRKMSKASKALGDGDLTYTVDTKYAVLEFKEMGDSLNNIAAGMEVAIEEKMKSERMKTELISNVSHDIKTPLTSIVNYADLISKEETDNPKIHEYSEILLRQSDRLKRLTEDLVHASKVTSGNVEVQLVPCDIGVLLNQAIGEYEEKLRKSELKLVSKLPDSPVVIMADGRHMWRVFDNLLNNICKYAQEGSRVYLILESNSNESEKNVKIEFKNMSKYELDISESELMERFVRGDKSRHSEGNGLGLSIAKSLVEVQGGEMRLEIDGDLFKVILMF